MNYGPKSALKSIDSITKNNSFSRTSASTRKVEDNSERLIGLNVNQEEVSNEFMKNNSNMMVESEMVTPLNNNKENSTIDNVNLNSLSNTKNEGSLAKLPYINKNTNSNNKVAIVNKDEEVKEIRGHIPFVNDVDTWIKRNKLPPNTKVFVISQGYVSIKECLLERGWVENPHFESNCFHFKYTLKSRDLNLHELNDTQIVNHFSKASNITTKVG